MFYHPFSCQGQLQQRGLLPLAANRLHPDGQTGGAVSGRERNGRMPGEVGRRGIAHDFHQRCQVTVAVRQGGGGIGRRGQPGRRCQDDVHIGQHLVEIVDEPRAHALIIQPAHLTRPHLGGCFGEKAVNGRYQSRQRPIPLLCQNNMFSHLARSPAVLRRRCASQFPADGRHRRRALLLYT